MFEATDRCHFVFDKSKKRIFHKKKSNLMLKVEFQAPMSPMRIRHAAKFHPSPFEKYLLNKASYVAHPPTLLHLAIPGQNFSSLGQS